MFTSSSCDWRSDRGGCGGFQRAGAKARSRKEAAKTPSIQQRTPNDGRAHWFGLGCSRARWGASLRARRRVVHGGHAIQHARGGQGTARAAFRAFASNQRWKIAWGKPLRLTRPSERALASIAAAHIPRIGKVIVKIKLTNLIDLGVQHRKLSKAKPRVVEVEALVDTGATRLYLKRSVIRALGL